MPFCNCEYSKLAVNIYSGCGHRCEYCYSSAIMRTSRETFSQPAPRKDILRKIKQDTLVLQNEHRTDPVLLCFTCDPYPPIDEDHQLTRQTIQILHQHDLNVTILTKGGKRAERDFDLLPDDDWLGATLTNLDDDVSLRWEPGVALPEERINSLRKAHEKEIKTWVSLEPVLYPETTREIIRRTYSFVDAFKVGTLNYHPHAKNIDWRRFAIDVQQLLNFLKCSYYLKNDLRKWID